MRGNKGFIIAGFVLAACGETTNSSAMSEPPRPGADAEFMLAIRKGPTVDHTAPGFRVRDAESDFIWIVSDDYEVRLDPHFSQADDQALADEIRHANTFLSFDDPQTGGRIRCKSADEDIKGDLQRTSLTAERIEATFRAELDACSAAGEPIAGRIVIFSGTLSLPRTD